MAVCTHDRAYKGCTSNSTTTSFLYGLPSAGYAMENSLCRLEDVGLLEDSFKCGELSAWGFYFSSPEFWKGTNVLLVKLHTQE